MNKKIPIALLIIALVAVSSLSLAGANASMVSQNTAANVKNGLLQRSYIRLNGIITEWGTTTVNGTLQTQAGTSLFNDADTNQLASATAIWTTNTSRPISDVESKQNFTYTFYTARLVNASVSTLSTSTTDPNYFLNGTWNVYTIVSNVTIITDSSGN